VIRAVHTRKPPGSASTRASGCQGLARYTRPRLTNPFTVQASKPHYPSCLEIVSLLDVLRRNPKNELEKSKKLESRAPFRLQPSRDHVYNCLCLCSRSGCLLFEFFEKKNPPKFMMYTLHTTHTTMYISTYTQPPNACFGFLLYSVIL